jgi:hypothetical protein
MYKKTIKTLSTLIKVEKGLIADLQPTLQDLMSKLIEIDQKIENLTEIIEAEKNFLEKESTNVDFLLFLDRIEKEKIDLLKKRTIIFEEYEIIHSQVMEHIKTEKAYLSIQDRKINEEKKINQKKEENIIEDIIQMRFSLKDESS